MDDNNHDDCGADDNDKNNNYFPSESMASLLGYMPTSLHNTTLYEIVADNDKVIFIINHNHYLLRPPHHNIDHNHEQQTCNHYNPHNFQIPLYNTLNMSGSVDTNGDQQVLNCHLSFNHFFHHIIPAILHDEMGFCISNKIYKSSGYDVQHI